MPRCAMHRVRASANRTRHRTNVPERRRRRRGTRQSPAHHHMCVDARSILAPRQQWQGTCGRPTAQTSCVVQMEPEPMPTRSPSTPAATSAQRPPPRCARRLTRVDEVRGLLGGDDVACRAPSVRLCILRLVGVRARRRTANHVEVRVLALDVLDLRARAVRGLHGGGRRVFSPCPAGRWSRLARSPARSRRQRPLPAPPGGCGPQA
jgi:hypothetical protein